ncbi:MAG: NAD(P)/FAD-dependent oxidoreductase [Acetobacteraceae bacterium]|nr:NAD(P)/FAD-dependent oxidoreductase [Acetobacteraceae bacterium]
MRESYDVVVVGAGPAGIFTALELAWGRPGLGVLMLEKGSDISDRRCPLQSREGPCSRCRPCFLLCGWGGAGAMSDGKLTLSPDIGGHLGEFVDRPALEALIQHVDSVYLRFGASDTLFGADPEVTRELMRRAATADLKLIPARVRHLGTERCAGVVERMHEELKGRVDIATSTPVAELLVEGGRACGVRLDDGGRVRARYVVVAPGREGAEWFVGEARRLGLSLANNPVDIGLRVEVPAVVMEPLTGPLYESKLVYYSRTFDDQVRTFCMCPYGEVVVENNQGLLTVNGHSYAERKTDLTNFALLVSKTFTEPFREPLTYGRYIASLANMLGGGVLVQRLGDLLAGRRSSPKRIQKGLLRPSLEQATAGDLSLVLPYRHLTSLLEMLQAMDKITPGVYSRHTLLYGVEVKFYSARPQLSPALETQVENLFAAGDGAGVTRGLVQASASGVHVAREILRREAGAEPGRGRGDFPM